MRREGVHTCGAYIRVAPLVFALLYYATSLRMHVGRHTFLVYMVLYTRMYTTYSSYTVYTTILNTTYCVLHCIYTTLLLAHVRCAHYVSQGLNGCSSVSLRSTALTAPHRRLWDALRAHLTLRAATLRLLSNLRSCGGLDPQCPSVVYVHR